MRGIEYAAPAGATPELLTDPNFKEVVAIMNAQLAVMQTQCDMLAKIFATVMMIPLGSGIDPDKL